MNVIKSGLIDFKNDFKEMYKNEIKIKNPDRIVDIIKKILEFNKQNQTGEGLTT